MAVDVITQTLTDPVDPPLITDDEATFDTKAFARVDWQTLNTQEQQTLITQYNASVLQLNAVYELINNQAVSGGFSQAYINNSQFEPYTQYTATGGETSVVVADNSNVTVYKNGALLAETTDYTINIDGVTIDFVASLVLNDLIQVWDLNTLSKRIDVLSSEIDIDFASDANITLTKYQNLYRKYTIKDTGVVLTASRDIVFNTVEKDWFIVTNETAQSLVFKVSGQTGITVPSGETYMLKNDGTDIIDSEEYSDSGLVGTPDVGFSSTGARIYPNGIIVGKSSNGTYTKYPCGKLTCYRTEVLNLNITSTYDTIYWNGSLFVERATAHQFIDTNFASQINPFNNTGGIWTAYATVPTVGGFGRFWLFSTRSRASVDLTIEYLTEGRWR